MALKLMYITNNVQVAQIAESSGVDRIFVDMEYIGKSDRQGGMNTVQNHHTIEDVRNIKEGISKAKVMCRVNPIHPATEAYCSSEEEINGAIEAGADILMLPFFKTAEEVRRFVGYVDGRAKTLLLVETPEAVEVMDDILDVPGVDEVLIGLNDLSLGYGMKFMFEPLANGTVDKLCKKFRDKKIPYGFGGIAAPGLGDLPSEYIIREHYRLGSTCVILSRSFCNTQQIQDLDEIRSTFRKGMNAVRTLEQECVLHQDDEEYFSENQKEVVRRVRLITGA